MSRSSAQRQQQKQHAQELLVQPQSDPAAAAAEYFDMFCQTTTMRQVLGLHRNMCDVLGLRPSPLNEFYPKVKEKIKSWKAQALWKKFDARAAHRVYGKGNACTGTRVLVIGAGPCGLRTAIEAQLLGAKVVVVEKRDRISRNNVLHLWPFVITDLRNLGAKKFYGKFCAGSIDHISIRQLQCILLKVALLLGVEVHEGVSFENTIEPSDGCGWRAAISPADHVVSHYEFDVLIGADGKRNTLEGFRRKEFRGKLAIAITANFVNRKTEAEAKAEEISGVAFIFNQSFFKELYHTTGIDLENIVYYKDETHYFVMTAKKHSLIDKGVIMQDCADPAELLSPANVNTEKLLDYAREAAEFSTKYQMPNLDFAVNHYGKPDVAMFDFTSMFAAETSCRVTVRKGYRLLQCLVGDSLLEPFWPTGSGCARGFLSSMDAAYTIKLWANPRNCTLGVLAQRESIYRLLGQTTPENLQRDIGAYTMDPATRYPNLNRTSVNIWQVKHLIDTDDPSILEQTFMDTNALQDKTVDTPVRRKRRSGDTMPLSTILLRWICAQLHSYEFIQELKEVSDIFTNGKVLCALINRYRPDLVDLNSVKSLSPIECNELAFTILEEEMNIPRIMSGKDSMQLNNTDSKVWLNYLEQICEVFRGEIPHVKHPKMDVTELREKYRINHRHVQPDFSKLLQISSKQKPTIAMQDSVDVPQNVQRRSVLDEDKLKRHRKLEAAQAAIAASGSTPGAQADTPRRAKKRRNVEKSQNLEERQKRLEEIEQNRVERQSRRRQQRYQQTQNFYKSLHMLQANTLLRESDSNEPFEDYSIFLYRQQAPEFNDRVKELERKLLFPDRERSDIPSALPRGATDEQFNDRIKSMEQRMSARTAYGTDKKPKDLMRAIGKIDSSDWNVREIEKKIEQAKKTEIHGPMGREKVPKWSKEQFMARQNKMAKPTRQDSSEEKFKEIDRTIKNLDKQLKEGNVLEVGERGRNKVASIAGQFVRKEDNQMSDDKNPSVQKSSSKVALAFKKQAASEKCHFCKQTVYLMEKTIAEDLTFHRACLKCHHCHTSLRMGGYAFDRDDPNGRFYCTQHFRLPAKAIRPVVRKSGQRKPTQQQLEALAANAANSKLDDAGAVVEDGEAKTPEKLRGHTDSVAQLDLLDRGQTPERIEFENADAMSDGEPSEEHIIDEHEWSGRNFLPESNNDSESDLSSSDDSESETDSDIFEEVNDSPLGAQTLQLATDWIGKQNYTDSDDSDDFYDSSEGIADDGKDDTEGEEFKKARELRREEVRLLPLPPNLPTDTETESKMLIDNKENIESVASTVSQENMDSSKGDKEKESANISSTPEKSSLLSSPPPTKTDIEKIEQREDRKFSAEIDAISEKLYHMNNMVKMNKDLETLAKENLVKSDIMKKLTLKEKWLAANNPANKPAVQPTKSKFEEKIDAIKAKSVEKEQKVAENEHKLTVEEVLKELKPRTPDFNSSRPSPLQSNPLFKKAARENMLDIVKDIDLGKVDMEGDEEDESKDIGKLLYDIDNPIDPMMASKMKDIEMKNFAGTMDLIKSQMVEPNVSTQANIDLAKYFPNQKQDKVSAGAKNKNQKNLKDVDLAKYFPTSPLPSRKSSVVTVAEKLKRSSTEKSVPASDTEKKKPKDKKLLKRGESFNLRDHQLDGAVDLPIKPKPVKVVTTAATASVTKKGNVKIIKTKSPKVKKRTIKKVSLSGSDDADDILDEIWRQAEEEMGSPSLEYQDLFKEEKSPSEDISDKLEGILEECGIDMSKKRRKKVTKAKSFAEGDLKYNNGNKSVEDICMDEQEFDDEDRPKGVQNILKRFESLRSVDSDETPKLTRKDPANKSRESLVSQESVVSLSDLEKTMDYLKSEWRNEATNFLQMKREKFFGQKRIAEDKENASEENQKKNKVTENGQSKQSKIASFFGIGAKQKSPQLNSTQLQKSPKSSALPIKKETEKNSTKTNKANTNLSPKNKNKPSSETTQNIKNVSLLQDESEQLLLKLEKERSIKGKKESTKESVPTTSILGSVDEAKNPETRTEDIRNLPKTGCDKSQNNSRRGSVQSLGSRRCSNSEKLDDIAKYAQLLSPGTDLQSNIDELFDKIVTEFDGIRKDEQMKPTESDKIQVANTTGTPNIIELKEEECDSLCTTISKSPSCEGLGVKPRGSSEDRSIENLFSKFTDEMLVNVEFDSNDEVLSITPTVPANIEKSQITKEFPPQKPQRRSKSSSSSSETCIPIAPQRLKKKLAKLSPYDMPSSIQDRRKHSDSAKTENTKVKNFPLDTNSKIIVKQSQVEAPKFPDVNKNTEFFLSKEDNFNVEKGLTNRRLSKDSRDSIRQQPVSPTAQRKNSIPNLEKHKEPSPKEVTANKVEVIDSVGNIKKELSSNDTPNKTVDLSGTVVERAEGNEINDIKPNNIPVLDTLKAGQSFRSDENVVEEKSTENRKMSQTNIDLSELESLGEKRRLIEAKYKERRVNRENSEANEGEKLKDNKLTSSATNGEKCQSTVNSNILTQEKEEKPKEKVEPRRVQEKNIVGNETTQNRDKNSTNVFQPDNGSGPSVFMKKDNPNNNVYISIPENPSKMNLQINKKEVKEKGNSDALNPAETIHVPANLEKKDILPAETFKDPENSLQTKTQMSKEESKNQSLEQKENTTELQPASEIYSKNNEATNSVLKEEQGIGIVPVIETEMEQYEKLRQRELLEREKQYRKIEENKKDDKEENIKQVNPVEKESSISPEKLIEQFETERRLSLIERDREYLEKVKTEDWYKPPALLKLVPNMDHEKSSSIEPVGEIFKNRQWPDGVTDFTKVNSEIVVDGMPSETDEEEELISIKEISNSKEKSVESNIEVPASPMPRRRFVPTSPELETEENKIVKALEQERRQSLIEREKIYEERKASNASTLDTQSLSSLQSIFTGTPQSDDNKMLDLKVQSQKNCSPTGSMRLLNNLAQNDEELEKQLLKQHEEDRKKALQKREQEYAVKMKPEDFFKGKNEDILRSKVTTPSSQSKMSTPLSQSKRASPVRDGTPPMLKKLDIADKTTTTPLISRRPSSTFAMLEHLEKKEPVIAPMPKKLEFPKVVPKYVPEKNESEDVEEVFQNRPWPKPELESDEEQEESKKNEDEKETKPEIEMSYPLPEVFRNRQWPDGVTKYEEKQRANSLEPSTLGTNTRNARNYKKDTKSFAEIMKKPAGHDSVQSLPQTTAHSSRSSTESDYGFARPQLKPGNRDESIDASTRILLSRGKHLHDRKCDFLSDREADRIAYKRPITSVDERLDIEEDNLRSYRPRSYAGTTRFPSSSDLSRRNRYDYLGSSSSYAPISDYSSNSSRLLATSSIGLGYHVPTVTSSGLRDAGYGAHLSDIYRRSPSRPRDTSIRDSCKLSLNPHLQMKLNLIRQLRYPPIRNSTMMKSLEKRQKFLSMIPI